MKDAHLFPSCHKLYWFGQEHIGLYTCAIHRHF